LCFDRSALQGLIGSGDTLELAKNDSTIKVFRMLYDPKQWPFGSDFLKLSFKIKNSKNFLFETLKKATTLTFSLFLYKKMKIEKDI
jgi:hypothetical protein